MKHVGHVLINGQPGSTVPFTDRGLSYGDGLFETIAAYGGRPRFWERHMRRLESGCRRLKIPMPDPVELRAEAAAVADHSGRTVLKILVTRGGGGRGYRPAQVAEPTRIVARYPWPEFPVAWHAEGITARVCDTRLGCNPALAGVKHLNRLEQVMARAEWDDPQIAEGLMLDTDGRAIEGVMSNLFMVRGGTLVTPDLSRCGVAGVIRGWVLDTAGMLGISAKVADIRLEDLWTADELFVTNAIAGIWPVRKVDGHGFPAGTITRQMQEALARC